MNPNFTEENIKALYEYAFGYTTDMNYRFRTSSATPNDKKEASKISALMTAQKIPTVYRSTSCGYMQKWFGVYKDHLDVWIGKFFVDPGFCSTSKDPGMPWNNYPKNSDTLYMTITSKERPKAIDINEVLGKASPSPGDKEVLFDRNTKFKIVSYTVKSGIYYLDIEVI